MVEENAKQKSVFDTDRQYLGDVYAKALLGLGRQAGTIDKLMDELHSFVAVVGELPKLRAALESPRIAYANKESIIDKMLAGRASRPFINFVKVLCQNGRFDCLSAVQSAAQKMHDESSGRVQAVMTTAKTVDEAVKTRVASRLAQMLGKQVAITAHIDKTIIGGLVIRVGDTVYDASVKNQLNQVRSSAIDRANQEIRKAIDRFALDA